MADRHRNLTRLWSEETRDFHQLDSIHDLYRGFVNAAYSSSITKYKRLVIRDQILVSPSRTKSKQSTKMKLSMLILVTLSVATLTLTKPTEIEAPSKLAGVDVATSSLHVIYESYYEWPGNTTQWSIRLAPFRPKIKGLVVENLRGCRITGIISGIGDMDLTLDLEKIPGQTMFFQFRFYGASSTQYLSEVMEPRVQVTTETEAPSKIAVVDGATASSHLITSGNFQSSLNTTRWSIRLDPRSRISGFVIENLRGSRITGVISGIGDWDLTLDLEQIPGQTIFFQYRFYGAMSANSNQLLSEVMEPRVHVE